LSAKKVLKNGRLALAAARIGNKLNLFSGAEKMRKIVLLMFVLTAVLTNACVNAPQNGNTAAGQPQNTGGKIKIGFAMDTVKEERWQRDRDAFEKHCKELNVECVITVANNSGDRQINDVDNLLTQGINVLVIAPHDATGAASMVEKAKAQNVPVISYDRLINSDKIDLYISHQVPVIGRKMAEYAVQKKPTGNYVMVYGAMTDNNSHIMKKAQLEVLNAQPGVKIVAEQHIPDWSREQALNFAENTLTQQGDKVDVFVVSNDGMASGVIAALDKRGLSGKILVTGQDADKPALQSIAEGKQTMTVYKPIIPLANSAVEAAIKLAKKESLSGVTQFQNDAIKKSVPAILLEVVSVDKDNLMQTVIKDGYAKYEDVYANVPPDQRPKQ
jgi:D-xylose transport system substrate-binding protein